MHVYLCICIYASSQVEGGGDSLTQWERQFSFDMRLYICISISICIWYSRVEGGGVAQTHWERQFSFDMSLYICISISASLYMHLIFAGRRRWSSANSSRQSSLLRKHKFFWTWVCIYASVYMHLYVCIIAGGRRRRCADALRETSLFSHESVYMHFYICICI